MTNMRTWVTDHLPRRRRTSTTPPSATQTTGPIVVPSRRHGATMSGASRRSATQSVQAKAGTAAGADTTTTVRVSLDSVLCTDTEDWTGADDFYIAGAIVNTLDGEQVGEPQAVLTKPLHINSDQDMEFGVGGGVVFERRIDTRSWLKIGLVCWDEDAGKDWDQYKALYDAVAKGIVTGVTAAISPAAGTIAEIAAKVVAEAIKADADDRLGDIAADLTISQLEPGRNHEVAVIEGNRLGGHHRYMVRYHIDVGEVVADTRVVMMKAAHSGKVLDVARAEHRNGAELIQYDSEHGRANQRFRLEPVGDYYRIVAEHSGKCLMVKDGSRFAGAPVVQSSYDGGDHQLWRMERETLYGADDARFVNKASGLYLSVRGASKANKAPVEVAERDLMHPDLTPGPGLHQLFHLISV